MIFIPQRGAQPLTREDVAHIIAYVDAHGLQEALEDAAMSDRKAGVDPKSSNSTHAFVWRMWCREQDFRSGRTKSF